MQECVNTNVHPSMPGFNAFLHRVIDPNFKFMYMVTFVHVFALFLFRCGVRKNNSEAMLAGRLKFSPLFYALNQTYYQETDYRDWKMRSLCPTTLLTFLNSNETFSVSGSDSKGEGGDFVLEAFNKKIKRSLPDGTPSEDRWRKLCDNADKLSEART